jgi:UbiD family decarboxylase
MSIRDRLNNALVVYDDISPFSDEITRLLQSTNNPVLFEKINNTKAAGNLFSTRSAITEALNIKPSDLMSHLAKASLNPVPTKIVESPSFKEVDATLNLLSLPIPKFFPKDGGRYITAGVIISEWNGIRNASFHRMMVLNKKEMVIRLVPRHLYTMNQSAKESGKELKIAICIGLPIEVLLSAAMSLDYGTDELEIASSLRMQSHGKPLETGITDNGIIVPSETEFVLEGRITNRECLEGPFVDSTGTYDMVRMQPIVSIDRLWTKKNPLFHIIYPGGSEHRLIQGIPKELNILRSVRQVVPQTHAARLTEGGCCWMHGVVSITKNNECDGKNAIMAALSGHTSMKLVTIVDEDIDIFDDRDVEWAIATRFQGNNLIIIPDASGSTLDPSVEDTTYKIGIDATIPMNRNRSLYERAKSQDSNASK